jgi:hypothetical protein
VLANSGYRRQPLRNDTYLTGPNRLRPDAACGFGHRRRILIFGYRHVAGAFGPPANANTGKGRTVDLLQTVVHKWPKLTNIFPDKREDQMRGVRDEAEAPGPMVSPGLTELTVGFERIASDHQGVDFAGAIEDLEGLAVPEESLHAAAVVDT